MLAEAGCGGVYGWRRALGVGCADRPVAVITTPVIAHACCGHTKPADEHHALRLLRSGRLCSLQDQNSGLSDLALCLPGVLEGAIPTTSVPIRRYEKGQSTAALRPLAGRP